MQRLEASDERRVGRFVAETAAMDLGAQPFPTPFLSALRRLVPSDDVFFCELDRVREIELGQISEPVYDGPEAPVSYWEIRHEHPACRHHEVTGDFRAHRVSEFIGRRELRRSRIYADWFHPQGVEHELSVGIDAPLWHTKVFVFSRASGRDFTERDCVVLDAVRPLIAERYALWLSQRRLGQVLGLVDSGGSSVVLLDGPDHVAFATEPASALLERYFGSTRGALPPAIVTWLGAWPREPLEVSADHGSLVVHAVDGALLLEERPADLGLTRREREVVELVGEGLTNAQIAERLWISPGTVRRHLENAYEKLGVSTRTAAVRALSRDI
jgi:DNA-binding CsgD family transcriptional regulator